MSEVPDSISILNAVINGNRDSIAYTMGSDVEILLEWLYSENCYNLYIGGPDKWWSAKFTRLEGVFNCLMDKLVDTMGTEEPENEDAIKNR